MKLLELCPICHGTKKVLGQTCLTCDGTGEARVPDSEKHKDPKKDHKQGEKPFFKP